MMTALLWSLFALGLLGLPLFGVWALFLWLVAVVIAVIHMATRTPPRALSAAEEREQEDEQARRYRSEAGFWQGLTLWVGIPAAIVVALIMVL